VAAQAAQSKAARRRDSPEVLRLGRNFLHAASLEFAHPVTGRPLQLEAPLPKELERFIERLESASTAPVAKKTSGVIQ
jgi:transcriptional regulator of NAD metabolism